jgi:hypothetical protein
VRNLQTASCSFFRRRTLRLIDVSYWLGATNMAMTIDRLQRVARAYEESRSIARRWPIEATEENSEVGA